MLRFMIRPVNEQQVKVIGTQSLQATLGPLYDMIWRRVSTRYSGGPALAARIVVGKSNLSHQHYVLPMRTKAFS